MRSQAIENVKKRIILLSRASRASNAIAKFDRSHCVSNCIYIHIYTYVHWCSIKARKTKGHACEGREVRGARSAPRQLHIGRRRSHLFQLRTSAHIVKIVSRRSRPQNFFSPSPLPPVRQHRRFTVVVTSKHRHHHHPYAKITDRWRSSLKGTITARRTSATG